MKKATQTARQPELAGPARLAMFAYFIQRLSEQQMSDFVDFALEAQYARENPKA